MNSELDRRSFLSLGSAFAVAPFGGALFARGARSGGSEIDVGTFAKEAAALKERLAGDVSARGQDVYLHALASLAARLGDVPEVERNAQSAGYGIGAHPAGEGFAILDWKLAPNAEISPHPHRYGNVVTLLLEGEARVRNYETAAATDYETKEPFLVRRTHEQVLTPRGINLVSLARDYVHGFVAGPNGARALDLTTRIAPRVPTPTLVIDATPKDAARLLFEARWRWK